MNATWVNIKMPYVSAHNISLNVLNAWAYARIKVSVLKFLWMPVDTTFIVSAYVMIMALSHSLMVALENLSLDGETGDFNLPTP